MKQFILVFLFTLTARATYAQHHRNLIFAKSPNEQRQEKNNYEKNKAGVYQDGFVTRWERFALHQQKRRMNQKARLHTRKST
jgi:hypothetical protein